MNNIEQFNTYKAFIILVLMGIVFVPWAASAAQHNSGRDTDYIVQYSLLGLKESAQKMAQRNEWLISQINQMKQRMPALQQRMAILEGQKEKLELLSDNNLSSKTLRKYVAGESASTSMLSNQASLLQDQQDLQEKIQLEEAENQKLKESKNTLQDQISKLQYELNLLNVEKKNTHEKENWQQLIRYKEQSIKRLSNAQRTLDEFNGKNKKPNQQVQALEQEQKILQERVNQLENELKLSLNQENDIHQEILNIRGQHIQKITRLNQEVESLKLKLKEMEDTLSKANSKIQEKKIQLSTPGYSEDDLRKNLEFMTQENEALKKEMISLKDNLTNIESLR